jgi:hypothetical protein
MMPVVGTRPKQRIFPGTPRQVRFVRDFTRRVLAGCPVEDDAVLLASELAANAVMHTASGRSGVFAVVIDRAPAWVTIEVHDGGSEATPGVLDGSAGGESGRGLSVVQAMASRWGYAGGPDGRVVWFELEWT